MIRLEEDQIQQWNQLLLQFPDAHILQTSQWAEAKKQNGWSPNDTFWKAAILRLLKGLH